MSIADQALAFWISRAGHGEIRPESLPCCEGSDVLVRTLFSGISRGTECLVFRGEVPASEYARMRAPWQAGAFPAPVKYGYMSVGTVERGPAQLTGRQVFCLYPHQTRYVVPASAVFPLPRDVPASRAILAAHLETALNGLWDAGVRLGDRVAVVGAGTLGCLVAWLAARIPGCLVELVDVNRHREAVAHALGARFAVPEEASRDADLVVHASGTPDGLVSALRLAGFESTVLELSWYGTRSVTLPLGEAFHAQRLTLKSSQVGAVATAQRARWTTARRLELAIALLVDPVLDALITGEDGFDALPRVLARLASAPGDSLCHRIAYDRAG